MVDQPEPIEGSPPRSSLTVVHYLRYFLGELARNLRRQPLLILTTVTTVATSLLLLGFFATIWLGAERLLGQFAEEVHLTAYLQTDLDPERIADVIDYLQARPEVAVVQVRTIEEDRARNLELIPIGLRSGISRDLIPGEPCVDIVLRPKDRTRAAVRDLALLANSMRGVSGVASVLSGGEKVQLAFAVASAVRIFGLGVCILLGAGAVFFVFATVRLSVHARKEEIEVRQLMGATRSFVRIPFYLEGAVEGCSGAIVAVLAVWYLLSRFNTYLHDTQLIRFEFEFVPVMWAVGFVACGSLLGMLGSAVALGRYLRRHR